MLEEKLIFNKFFNLNLTVNILSPEQKQKFNEIRNLISSNEMHLAANEMGKLTPQTRDRCHMYLANNMLLTESARYRGRVIEMSINLELVLANILSQYFAAEAKIELLNSMVFDRMDLQKKLNILKSILKTKHVDIWKKEQLHLKSIGKLIFFRNDIAHSHLDSTQKYLDTLKKKVDLMISKGIYQENLEEIQLSFFENHKWVSKKVKWQDIVKYHKGIYNGVNKIDYIGNQIISKYIPAVRE